MHTRTFVVTGGTSGLGLALLQALAPEARGGGVLAGARTDAAAARAQAAVASDRLHVHPLDLASLASVSAFADSVIGALGTRQIDGIACVGGLQLAAGDAWSADGHELTFAVNHLAHHLLVRRLLPHLAPGAPVVLVGSGTHDPADRGGRLFGFRGARYLSAAALAAGTVAPGTSPRQAARDRYATSKLCNVLSAYEWARRVAPGLGRTFVVDPGLMPGTGLARRHPAVLRWAWSRLLPVLGRVMPGASTPAQSARVIADLLLGNLHAGRTGVHVDHHGRESRSSADSYRIDLAADLFETSDALVSGFTSTERVATRRATSPAS